MEDPIELARRAMTERRLQAEKRMPAEDPYLAGVNYPAHGSFTPDLISGSPSQTACSKPSAQMSWS